MNKIYKLIWNKQLESWQAVSELAKNHISSSSSATVVNPIKGVISKGLRLIFFGLAVLPLSVHAAISNTELPTGAQINSGSASIIQAGNTLNIQQNSQNLSANWNTFNIGQDSTVNFLQPNQSSVAINHVIDSNASQIMGRLNANGQVFLLNPNGVVFSKTAQVNVGGLVASTLSLNDADIQNGKYTLKGDVNSTATVENQGLIQTLQGGTIALIAPNVKNTGTISTPKGVTHLTAASQVTLALQDGSLTQYQVDQGVFKGLVENGGAIIADNGAVYLTAKAKDSLSKAVVNHTGIIEANRLTQNAKGEIILLGDMQSGETNVSGTLKAEGKNGQDGGFIETSAAKVSIDKNIKISTLSEGGSTGEWLIDPYNVVISNSTDTGAGFTASQDDTVINATTLKNALATTGVTVSTGGTAVGTQEGNITVDADLTWTSNSTLTLQADKDIQLNKKITATNGGLTLNAANNISATEAINVGTFTLTKGNWLQNTAILPSFYARDFRLSGGSFVRALSGNGTSDSPWQLTDIFGVQGMGTKLNGNFTLANDIDASGTVNWNSGAGFNPIGNGSTYFTGVFDGLDHTINGLTINRPTLEGVGLIGWGSNIHISNIGLLNANIIGGRITGVLAGYLRGNTSILNSYTAGAVSAASSQHVGGILGAFEGGIAELSNSYSTALIQGNGTTSYIGGLIGTTNSNTTVSDSYYAGTIENGNSIVGGILGGSWNNNLINIKNSYVVGSIKGNSTVGAIVGGASNANLTNLKINNSFFNIETVGQIQAVGSNSGTLTNVIGLTTAQMFDKSYLTGFDFNTVWGNGDNQTTPYLLNLANNQVFNKNDLPTGTITSTNRPALYTAILNATQLQNMNQNLSGKYLLGNDIDASDTKNWNSGAGFRPIGIDALANFSGKLDGLGHTVNDLYINTGEMWNAALIGGVDNASVVIRNIGLINANVNGSTSVGGLVGALRQGTIENSFTTGSIYGTGQGIGGLVGYLGNSGTIKNSYSAADVSGAATSQAIGGLVGRFAESAPKIINSYSSGKVTGGISQIGGLVGNNASSLGVVTNSFWNTTTSGRATSAGGTGKTTAQMQDLDTFVNAGWGIDDVGGTGKVWRIYNGLTAPLLRNFLTSLTITNADTTTTYNGKNQGGGYQVVPAGTIYDSSLILSQQKNATPTAVEIDLTKDLYSVQQGYDLIVQSGSSTGKLTINKAVLNAITGITANNKTYDGTSNAVLDYSQASIDGIIYGADQVLIAQTGTAKFADKNAAEGKTVAISGLSLGGTDAGNYTLQNTTASTTASISKAVINAITGITANNKTYDGTTAATLNTGSVGFTGMVSGDELTVSTATGSFSDKNAAEGKTVAISGLSLGGTDAGNYTLQNTTASTTADISKAVINTITGITANNKTYDGTSNAVLDYSQASIDGIIYGADQVLIAQTGTAKFADKNAAEGKTVAISGLSLGGTDAGNYTLQNTTASTTASISKAVINAITGITANNKTYDGTTAATLNTGSVGFTGMVSGDELTVSTATGSFSDKNAAEGKTVAISGLSLGGTDAGNYTLQNTTASTTADISKANISEILGIIANSRAYDGQTLVSLNTSKAQFNGMFAGDELTVASAIGQFDSSSTGNTKTVSILGLSLGGKDAQNYSLLNTTSSTNADVYMQFPDAYLQATQLKRPRYLPDTLNVLNNVNIQTEQGVINTTGIKTLSGEH
ncbi:YDG domain-containing protein [Acinetobacter kanungonis]|uniref:YDG domain-containing protein n=1 Tax=Acinetobacter kanungonis TaxID=2699469 RepID=UPI00137A3636|nr:YDG domain-containing protein [Acinetobacter kanungonis]NCI79811.1 filamentous hemagglutinin N-terminal domain-containing protein [Acinetobacter kanungonis]